MTTLSVVNLNKSFGPQHVLKNVNANFAPGELVTLLGPSGCGKTTLLRIVAGLEFADTGQVLLDDRDIAGLPPNSRNMGMVFQAYSLFPNMTAAQNVAFGLQIRKVPKAQRDKRVSDLMEMVGLGPFQKKYPHQMSGGQQQRVALARALAIQPALLLLDEPLSALDAKVRVQLRDEIRRIQKETGVTTIFVTHDQEEAMAISDRVAVMSKGIIDQFAPPPEIYQQPASQFVVEFIGTTSKLQGKVIDGTSGTIEVAGMTMPAGPAKGMTQGTPVTIYIRPESLHVTAQTEDGAGGIPANVVDVTFMGAQSRVRVKTAEDSDMVADMPTQQAMGLQMGATVVVSWVPEAAHILAAA